MSSPSHESCRNFDGRGCSIRALGDHFDPAYCANACWKYDGPGRRTAGAVLARGVQIATIGTVKHCNGCTHRAAVVNRVADRAVNIAGRILRHGS